MPNTVKQAQAAIAEIREAENKFNASLTELKGKYPFINFMVNETPDKQIKLGLGINGSTDLARALWKELYPDYT